MSGGDLEHRVELALARLHQSLLRVHDVADACWAVTEQAIALLDLEDCVVYLLGSDGVSLKQHAAWGPKCESPGLVRDPLVLRIGEGIVGACARSQRTQWVPDVRLDPRYIADDQARGSELAVPILVDEHLIGVLDSEHSATDFFSAVHARTFVQIAGLLAAHLPRILNSVDR
jgi:GAF domain-containing protein